MHLGLSMLSLLAISLLRSETFMFLLMGTVKLFMVLSGRWCSTLSVRWDDDVFLVPCTVAYGLESSYVLGTFDFWLIIFGSISCGLLAFLLRLTLL